MDGEEDAFFGTNETPEAERPGGLIVPQRARQIFDTKGNCVWDELLELSREYVREGRPAVVFDDGDGPPPAIRP